MEPLYAQVKSHILNRIQSGAWAAGQRVPSENEIVAQFSISRMTANRALRELSDDGYLARVPGVGTFVKERPHRASLLELRNIADEIATRGHVHTVKILLKEGVIASPALAVSFEETKGITLFHIKLVHSENGLPVQLEDRFVNPRVFPQFLKQDFTQVTPTAYLLTSAPAEELEHTVEAITPDAATRRLLQSGDEPCLSLHRRSWSSGRVATIATLIYPASRYALYSRAKTGTPMRSPS